MMLEEGQGIIGGLDVPHNSVGLDLELLVEPLAPWHSRALGQQSSESECRRKDTATIIDFDAVKMSTPFRMPK